MTWRRVAIYWALALAVCAQLAWTVRSRGAPQVVEAPVVAPIVALDASAIDAVRTETPSGLVDFVKEDGRWRAVVPAGAKVSSDLVGAFLDALTTIPPIEVITPQADDAGSAAYGLNPAQSLVRLAGGGKPLATVELGVRNPTRTAVYARRSGDERIYLLGLNAQYYLELIYEQAARGEDAAADIGS